MNVTLMAGMMLGGPLIDALGPQAAYGLAGLLSIGAALLGGSVVVARRGGVVAMVDAEAGGSSG